MSNAESRRVSPSNCNSRSRENCDESFRFFIPPSLVGCPKAVIRSEPRNGKKEMEGVCSGFANRTTAAEQRKIAARVHVGFCSTTEPTVMSRTARKPIKYGPKWSPIRLKRLEVSTYAYLQLLFSGNIKVYLPVYWFTCGFHKWGHDSMAAGLANE